MNDNLDEMIQLIRFQSNYRNSNNINEFFMKANNTNEILYREKEEIINLDKENLDFLSQLSVYNQNILTCLNTVSALRDITLLKLQQLKQFCNLDNLVNNSIDIYFKNYFYCLELDRITHSMVEDMLTKESLPELEEVLKVGATEINNLFSDDNTVDGKVKVDIKYRR